MNLDDDICCCYHVPLRKLINFARQRRPPRASQMSECFNAGTGCGWCIPILRMIHERVLRGEEPGLTMTPDEYAARRAAYRAAGGPRNTFDAPPAAHPPPTPDPGDPPRARGSTPEGDRT